MSKLKHTLAPWTAISMYEAAVVKSEPANFIVADNMSYNDAVLVAAAPDMYAALKYIKYMIDEDQDVMQELEIIVSNALEKVKL